MTVYADQIATFFEWDGDRGALLRYALHHDADETISGDMPGPFKRKVIDKVKMEELLQGKMTEKFPGKEWERPENYFEIRKIVKVADLIDEALSVLGEMQMGNGALDSVHTDVIQRLFGELSGLAEVLGASDNMALSFRGAVDEALRRERFDQSRIVVG